MVTPHETAFQRRINEMLQTQQRIKDFVDSLLSSPGVIEQDIIEEFEATVKAFKSKKEPAGAIPALHRNASIPIADNPDDEAGPVRAKVISAMKSANTPLTFAQIVEFTGLTLRSIQTLIYKRSYGQFFQAGKTRMGQYAVSTWDLTELGRLGQLDRSKLKPGGVAKYKRPEPIGLLGEHQA